MIVQSDSINFYSFFSHYRKPNTRCLRATLIHWSSLRPQTPNRVDLVPPSIQTLPSSMIVGATNSTQFKVWALRLTLEMFVAPHQLSQLSRMDRVWHYYVIYCHIHIWYRHENVSGYYRTSAYFFSKLFCDLLPYRTFPVIIYGTIVYWMMGEILTTLCVIKSPPRLYPCWRFYYYTTHYTTQSFDFECLIFNIDVNKVDNLISKEKLRPY